MPVTVCTHVSHTHTHTSTPININPLAIPSAMMFRSVDLLESGTF